MEKMLQAMMKRFPWFIGMGVMIVIIAVVIAAVNATNAATYYAVDKATRDASTGASSGVWISQGLPGLRAQ